MSMNPKPFLKWAGGKTQLLLILSEHIPKDFDTYYEPFVGAGALLFHLLPPKAVISDITEELINCYRCIADKADEVKNIIDSFPISAEFFYELRATDRDESYSLRSLPWKAARTIYLNKTCFNGLYRVNSRGQFNAPRGKYQHFRIYDSGNIRAVQDYLKNNKVMLLCVDFQDILLSAPNSADFVYLDPPYDVLNDTSNFTGYASNGFNRQSQIRLKTCVDALTHRNVKVLQSNADTPFIRSLYADYEIIEVQAKRSINSKGNKRGKVNELLIKNY